VAAAVAAILVLLIGGVLAVVLLAGGGDERPVAGDDTSDSSTVSTPATTPPTGETQPTGATATTGGSTSAEQTLYCRKMSIVQLELTSFRTGTLTDSDLDAMVTGLDELAPIAPAEVAPDVDTFLGGLTSLQSLLDELDVTFEQFQDVAFLTDAAEDWTPEQVEQIQNVSTQLTDPAFVNSGTNIDTDFRGRC